MGVVFKAQEESLNRTVALKVLSPALAGDRTSRERFLREARLAAAIIDEHVVTIHAVSGRLPHPYLVMEFVEGESLEQMMHGSRVPPFEEVVRIGVEVANGLQAAHQKGVIHRDIKPANILIHNQSGKAQITDFGLARLSGDSRLTKSGMLIGTPGYLAPESVENLDNVDHRVDLFGLGAVLYAICNGKPPFHSNSLLGSLRRMSTEVPTPLGEVNASVPDWFSEIVMRLLSVSPERRFANAGDVSSALRAGISQSIIKHSNVEQVHPNQRETLNPDAVTTVERPSPMPARRRWAPHRIGLQICLFLVLLCWLLWNRPFGLDAVVESAGTLSDNQASEERAGENQNGVFFVRDVDDTKATPFFRLEDAMANASLGSTIEIHQTGLINVAPLVVRRSRQVPGERLSIVAGKGHHPILVFEPIDKRGVEAMIETEVNLALQGIELRLPPEQFEQDFALIGAKSGSDVFLESCSIVVEGNGTGIYTESDLNLENCEIVATESLGIRVETEMEIAIRLRNCWLTSNTGFGILAKKKTSVELQRCTLMSDRPFLVESDASFDECLVAITAERSIFDCGEGVLQSDHDEPFDKTVSWIGRNNVFSGAIETDGALDPSFKTGQLDFEKWCRQVEEIGSRYVKHPFDGEIVSTYKMIMQSDVRLSTLKTVVPIDAGAQLGP